MTLFGSILLGGIAAFLLGGPPYVLLAGMLVGSLLNRNQTREDRIAELEA